MSLQNQIFKSLYAFGTNSEPYININAALKPISKIKNKQIYLKLLIKLIKPPTAIETWINIFPFLENQD